MRHIILSSLFFSLVISSCKEKQSSSSLSESDSVFYAGMHDAINAIKGLTVADGLEVTAFATEPMLINPTNMDVDDKGRVWITEAYNYRPAINGNPTKPEGDRIVILEDLDNDGRADTSKVFYQSPEINAPLGICVLGNRVIVSQSPFVWSLYDDNGDDKADRKEIMFQQIGEEQSDHGVHAFTFAADGKLYFNFGNAGHTLVDKNEKVVRDQDGDPIDNKKYRQGMIFRCDLDGTNVEVLADNFRNNYEVAVDSYGGIWQSDNDDDGNRSTRINFILPYGNYGYTDEMTGAGWYASRTNMEDSLPMKHWHQNDPGVVPNLLHTGAGSPTGLVIYEGDLMPSQFQGQMIHCDPGPNVVRSYSVEAVGAGYKASIINILKGERDQWFRPADISVAPDGSLFIADWYDPGVGGHQAGDQVKGRVYRVAPNDDAYTKKSFDYSTVEGAVEALQNPNSCVRYKGFSALMSFKDKALPTLEEMLSSAAPRMSARAFWVLMKMYPEKRSVYIDRALTDNNADIRMMALRASKLYGVGVEQSVQKVINDKSLAVKREAAIVLHHVNTPLAAQLWAQLAAQHDGKDRWYLEALGIGAEDNWNNCYAAYRTLVKDPFKVAGGPDVIWRSRGDNSVKDLATLASSTKELRYFRAFDFHTSPTKSGYLLAMLKSDSNSLSFDQLLLSHLDDKTVKGSSVAMKKLNKVLDQLKGTNEYVEMIRRYKLPQRNESLLAMALLKPDDNTGRNAVALVMEQGGDAMINKVIVQKDSNALKLMRAMAKVGSKDALSMLEGIMNNESYPENMRLQVASGIGQSWNGEEEVVRLLKAKKVPEKFIPPMVNSLANIWRGAIRDTAETFLPASMRTAKKKAPTLAEVNALTANVENGKKVFAVKCGLCHVAGNEGKDFGPALTQIGAKLPREQLYESIIHPSSGISFGYEGYSFTTKDGTNYAGIVASKSETDIILKYPGGNKQTLKVGDVVKSEQMKQSMMPEGLHNQMTKQELADLVGWLEGLR